MARGKHSVALFEVIQQNKVSRRGFSLRTPTWWFKGRTNRGGSGASAPGASPAAPPPSVAEDDLGATAPAPRTPGIDLKLDSDRQRITFQVTYTSAIVTGFALLVALSLAYVIGRQMTRGPASAVAGPSTVELRQGPARPQVLDLAASGSSSAKSATATQVDVDDAITALPQAQRSPAAAAQAPEPELAGQRIIGRNYVVVQIYPDLKNAEEARDLLVKNNLPCTIEKGLPGYAATSWYCVVGLTGFDRIRNNPQYDRYEKAIRDAGAPFAKSSKFKNFDPQAYRWR